MAHLYFNAIAALLPGELARAEDVNERFFTVSSGFDLLPTPRRDGTIGFTTPFTIAEPTAAGHPTTRNFVETAMTSQVAQAAASASTAAAQAGTATAAGTTAVAARDATFQARDLTLGYRDDSLAARNLAQGYRDETLTARNLTLTYRDATVAARDAAVTASNTATTQAGIATAQASNAATSAGQAGSARDAAISARDLTLGYRDASLAARDTTLSYRDETLAARNLTLGYRDSAQTSASNAATSATNAGNSATSASNSSLQASYWAQFPAGQLVPNGSGGYSALHWAQQAANSAASINGATIVRFQQFLGGAPTQSQFYRIASLPASAQNTYDHVHISGAVSDGWGSAALSTFDIVLGNRNAFSARIFWNGTRRTFAGIDCYVEADGSVSVYAVNTGGTFSSLSLAVLHSIGATTFAAPTVTTAPTGTLTYSSRTATPDLVISTTGNMLYRGATVWTSANHGAGSGLNADLLDGINSTSFVRNDGSNTYAVGTQQNFNAQGSGMGSGAANLASLRVGSTGAGAAMMQFERYGSFAAYFGLDTDNNFRVGGYSFGNISYRLWHEGNDGAGSGLDADLFDGLEATAFVRTGVSSTISGDNTLAFGPNANSRILRIGGSTIATNSTESTVVSTNGNLHLDCASGSATYLNYFRGSGTIFGNGAGAPVATMDASGQLFRGSSPYLNAANFPAASQARSPNTLVQRDGANGIFVGDVEANRGDDTGVIYFGPSAQQRFLFWNGSDYVLSGAGLLINGSRAWTQGNDGAGSGLDADLLDGLDSAQFMRATVDVWNNSADGTGRFYFGNAGRTFYSSANGHEWRHNLDTTTATLDSSGNFTAVGNVTAFSDARVKTEIATIQSGLELVERMRGVTYTRRDNGQRGLGVVAQEVREVVPQLVHDHEDRLSVAYGNMAGLFIEAIKELAARVRALEAGAA